MPRMLPCAATQFPTLCWWPFLTASFIALGQTGYAAEPALRLPLTISWGHRSPTAQPFYLRLIGQELNPKSARLEGGETGDELQDGIGIARTRAGAGDVDGISCELHFEPRSIRPITTAQSI